MKYFVRSALLIACAGSLLDFGLAQSQPASVPPPPALPARVKKRVLVIAQTRGYQHDSVPAAMAGIWKWGHDSGLWDAYLRTDTQLLTKKKLAFNTKTLPDFDAVVFASTSGELDLDDQQKADLLSFVHDDGHGFVSVHASADTNYKWPDFGILNGAWFDEHPWGTFDAPIIVEEPDLPRCTPLPESVHEARRNLPAQKLVARFHQRAHAAGRDEIEL
jgi:uncharacterized protein